MQLQPTILGIAIDVSGSMQSSVRNDQALDLSRLTGVERGLQTLIEDSRRLARTHHVSAGLPVRLFAYAFGLRAHPEYADLISMLRVAQTREFQVFLEEAKDRHRHAAEQKGEQMRHQAGAHAGIESLARSLFGSSVDQFKASLEESARRQLTDEAETALIADVLQYMGKQAEEHTLSVDEFGDLWGKEGGSFGEARRFLFGSTPMRSCLEQIVGRFEREKLRAATLTEERVLLILSDGEPTDGDTRQAATALRNAGIHVVGAYVTDRDVRAPRELPCRPEPSWPEGARLMFEMASPVDAAADLIASPWRSALENSGWTIPAGAHLFIQVNHSEVLADFMRVVATAIPAHQLIQKIV